MQTETVIQIGTGANETVIKIGTGASAKLEAAPDGGITVTISTEDQVKMNELAKQIEAGKNSLSAAVEENKT